MKLRSARRRGACAAVTSEDGFTLIEVVVALMLMIMVMAGTAGFFIKGVASTRLMQQRQSAVSMAQQAVEDSRNLSVAGLVLAAAAPVTVTGGPSNPQYAAGNINYIVRTTVTPCAMKSDASACVNNATPDPATETLMYRVDVNVRWEPGRGLKCGGAGGLCEHNVSTLRDSTASAVTNLNEVAQP